MTQLAQRLTQRGGRRCTGWSKETRKSEAGDAVLGGVRRRGENIIILTRLDQVKPRRRRQLQRRHVEAASQPEGREGLFGWKILREVPEAASRVLAEAVHGVEQPLEEAAAVKTMKSSGVKKRRKSNSSAPGARNGEFQLERPGGGIVLHPLASNKEKRVSLAKAACSKRSPIVHKLIVLHAVLAGK